MRLGLCPDCLSQVELTGLGACIRCGRHCRPGQCAPLDHRYGRVLSLAAYRGPWRQVVQNVKFGGDRGVALELARELAALAKEGGFARPQAVVPAPGAGENRRSFDLLALLCRELARSAGAPVREFLARRPGRLPQVKLDLRGRLEGLEDYIYLKKGADPGGPVLWLVDDVYTTGATADACAGALMAGGARSVYLLTLAV